MTASLETLISSVDEGEVLPGPAALFVHTPYNGMVGAVSRRSSERKDEADTEEEVCIDVATEAK